MADHGGRAIPRVAVVDSREIPRTFTGFIPPGSELAGDTWTASLEGKKIGIIGTIDQEDRPLVAMYINLVNLAKRMESLECQIRNTLPTRLLGLTLSWFEGR